MKILIGHLMLFICLSCVSAQMDIEVHSGSVMKFLRAMSNETKADTLNLPANSTSIRENITDTFSCENRTYGYYADVDNDCQIFHVCQPSQTPSGRNVTYKWSFICPAQTVFNQEVLVCTYPHDAIPCEDSPSYYDLNMEIGRVVDNKIEDDPKKETTNIQPPKSNKKTPTRKTVTRKQNIIVESLLNDVVDEEVDKTLNEMGFEEIDMTPQEIVPVVVEPVGDPELGEKIYESEMYEGEDRSMNWRGRKIERGGFRFKADV